MEKIIPFDRGNELCGDPDCIVCNARLTPHIYVPSMWQNICRRCTMNEFDIRVHLMSEDTTD
jgi:hypothetical protein